MVNAQLNNSVASTVLLSSTEAMAQPMLLRMQFLIRRSQTVLKLTVVIQELALR
jgi:hypothetical protein